jgi:hypothetical protein
MLYLQHGFCISDKKRGRQSKRLFPVESIPYIELSQFPHPVTSACILLAIICHMVFLATRVDNKYGFLAHTLLPSNKTNSVCHKTICKIWYSFNEISG